MSDHKAVTKREMAASESLLPSPLACNLNASSSTSSPRTSAAPGSSAELSETQFNASLDALMSGDNWLGMHYSQMASNSSSDGAELTTVGGNPPLVQSAPRIGEAMNSALGQLNPQSFPSNNLTISNPPTAVDIGSFASLFAGQSLPQFGTGSEATSKPSVPHTPSFPAMVTFAPIQPPSSSDVQLKPPASKRRRAGGSAHSVSISAVSEDEQGGDRSRRRNDRNQREQQRSQQIAQQICYLRDLLSAANVQFKPDKYSTLVTVGEFIKSLQERVELLDCEHKKLLNTIVQTTNAVNSQFLPQGGSESMKVADFFDDGKVSPLHDDECPPFVSSLDYKAVFDCCPVASAITSIDGRFLDCNHDFEELSGFSKSELVYCSKDETVPGGLKKPGRSMSLFNTVRREHMEGIFLAMSNMLKIPFTDFQAAESSAEEYRDADVWSGVVTLVRKDAAKVNLGVSLVRDNQGRPKFFNCTMIPTEAPITSSAAVG